MIWAPLALTFLLIAVLAVLRTRILQELSAMSLLLFGRVRPGEWLYTLIFLPGTILHELSHWIVAEILGVHTGKITILPDYDQDTPHSRERRLGSVETSRSDPFRGFLIGVAPLLTGLTTLVVLGSLLGNPDLTWLLRFVLVYGLIVVGSSMHLSRADYQSLPFILIFFVVLLAIFLFTPLEFPLSIVNALTPVFTLLNTYLSVTVLAILGSIGISYSIRRIIERIVRKRIIIRR